MTPSRQSGSWQAYLVMAACISMLAAGLITAISCETGTTDVCLMSKGMFPYLWVVLFIMAWPCIAIIGTAIRARRSPSASDPSVDSSVESGGGPK